MIKNNEVTIYHKTFNKQTRLEEWERFNYENAWIFGGKGAGINKGYDNANDVNVRIPYENNNLNINNFSIGDIIVKGKVNNDILTQQDLIGYETYNITSINDNIFALKSQSKHIHIGGK